MVKNYFFEKNYFLFYQLVSQVKGIAITLVFIIFFISSSFGQTAATYNFNEYAGTYTTLSSSATTAFTATDDAVTATAVTIPFTFNYAGTGYSALRISTNGFITLGNATTPSSGTGGYTPISSTGGAYSTAISGFARDLNSTVKYETLGSSPNRIFVIEWSGVARYVSGLLTENLNFQIRLNETSNIVEVVYGTMSTSHGVLGTGIGEVGLKSGPTVYNNVTMTNATLTGYAYTNNWNSLINGSLQTDTVPITSTVKPASGTTLKWTPSNCTLVQVALTASAITNSSATVSWTNSATYTSGYRIRWRKVDEDYNVVTWATPMTVTAGTTSYTISGLTPATYYVYSVEGLCSGTSVNNLSTVTTSNTTNGKGLFQTSLATCTTPTAQPTALNLTSITATSLSGSFTAASPAPSKYLVVRSTSATAPVPANTTVYPVGSSALGVGTYVVSNTATTTFSDSGLTNNTRYYYYVFSYNDSCTGAPNYLTSTPLSANTYTCLIAPTSNAGTAITSNGFTANWATVVGATGYLLDVSTSNTFSSFVSGYNGLAISGGSTVSQSIVGLSPNTIYYYRVRATNATSCMSVDSSTITVVTACSNATLTVSEGFNTSGVSIFPSCWSSAIVAVQTGTKLTFETSASNPTTTPQEGTRMVRYYSYNNVAGGSGSEERLISPPITTTGTTSVDVEFYWRNENNTSYNSGAYLNEGVQVQYSLDKTNWINAGSLFPRHDGTLSSGVAQWNLKKVTLPAGAGNQSTIYVAFKFHSEYGNNMFLDLAVIKPSPACLPPTALTTTAIGATTATFSWTAPSSAPASYDIYYGVGSVATPLAVPTALTIATTTSATNTLSVSSLNTNTSYQYYVRSACGGSDGNSTWAGPYTFLTACTAPSTQPTALNLTLITATTLSGSFTAASPVPSGYLVVRSLSPSLSANPIDATTYTAGNALGGGTVVQSGTSLTFTQTGLTANTQYYYFVFSFNNTSCSSGPKYLVTSPLTANSITCLATPTSSVATGVTPNSFVANWVSVTGATGYILDVATNSGFTAFVPGYNALALGAVTSHSISGLASNITYYYRVRATNSTTCTSANSTSQTAYTLAPPLNDDCTSATTLPCGTSNMAGTTAGTVFETISVSGWTTSGYGVWYSFAGDGNLNTISTTAGSGFDHELSIASGSCGTFTNIASIDLGVSGGTETYSFVAQVGVTYYVYIAYFGVSGSSTNVGTFTISRTCTAVTYCVPSSSVATAPNYYINNVSFLGTQNDISNNSTYSSTSNGYENFTGLASKPIQIQGEAVNIKVNMNDALYLKAWVDWNKDGDFTDVGENVYDAGVIVQQAVTFGFAVPNVYAGNYRVRIRSKFNNDNFNSCGNENTSDTEDYLLTVLTRCSAEILTITDAERCGPGIANLNATASGGVTEFRWYSALTGGSLVAATPTGNYSPTVSGTTYFYVTAFNGCETQIRKEVIAKVKELADIVLPTSLQACGDLSPVILSASADSEVVTLLDENFESGLGTMSAVQNETTNSLATWQVQTSPYKPNGTEESWLPSISSGFGSNKFVTATSDVTDLGTPYSLDNALQPTSSLNTTGFTDLTLKLKIYFSRYYSDNFDTTPDDEFVSVEASTNGGVSWISTPIAKYITDLGNPGAFATISLNLSSFINQSNFKFRIRYKTTQWTDGVAVDDIELYGSKTLVPSFTWAGAGLNVFTDLNMTIPYTAGTPALTVYAVPDIATLGNPTFNIDVTTQLTNGCSVTKTISVINKSKVWNGSVSSVWNNANNWSPVGVPSSTDCIIIPSTTVKPIISSDANGKNLEIKALGELVVNSNKTLAIEDNINVKTGGSLMFENSASLIQTNENPSINTGNIIYKRNTSNMLRYSYTYWASPVYATSQTLFALSSGTLADKYYSWNINSQSWLLHRNGGVTMEKAKGYIVRSPQTFPIAGTAASYAATFNGVPNNGLITIATQGSTTQDMWNLIGNPYPSALIADSFLSNTINPDLEGTIYLWTNYTGVSSVPNSGGTYSYTDNDYAVYNFSGGTTTAPATGSSIEPTGFVAAGQAFFVKGISNGSGTATFNNTMRKGEDNNQFFRRSSSHIEKNRLWLNLENAQGGFNQALIAYIEGATDNYDRGYDGELFGGNSATFYSLIPSKRLTIQGKALPFTENDIVPMGYKTTVAGNYKITLDHFDGLFESQNIYIKDNLLNVIHDIKIAPYNFTSAVGTFENRFEVVYYNEYLDVAEPNFNTESVIIYQKDKFIYVNAGLTDIDQLKVFDIHGRLIYEAKNINSTEAVIKNLPSVDQVLIIQIISVKGNKVSKKLVH